jgi:hypothetical protein
MFRKIRLVIEIDGYSYNNKYVEDLKRDERLKELGYKPIRFEEQEMLNPPTPFSKGDRSHDCMYWLLLKVIRNVNFNSGLRKTR